MTVSSVTLIALLGTLILAFAAARRTLAGPFPDRLGNATGRRPAAAADALGAAERYASVAAPTFASASIEDGLLATVPLDLLLQTAGWTPTFLIISLAPSS